MSQRGGAPPEGLTELSTRRYPKGGGSEDRADLVVVEEPLELRVSQETLAVTMRTPGHDRELAAGLLFSEGIIKSRDDISGLAHCGRPGDEGYGNAIEVTEAPGSRLDVESLGLARRGTLTTSACGVCGRQTIDDLLARCTPVEDDTRFDRKMLGELTDRLREQQPIFLQTGGLHAAAVASTGGEIECVREDVGRHNAVDKVVGRLLLDGGLPARGRLLVVSGRTSFEIVQKALLAGFPALVAVSAPTSLAVQTAARGNLTLAGFSRNGAFVVYAGAHRIQG